MPKLYAALSDPELIEKFRNGDIKAYNTLFDRYIDKMVGFTYSLLKDAEIARELVMDVMLRLWQKKGDIVVETELGPYLFKSLKNAVYNHLRKGRIITQPLEGYNEEGVGASQAADEPLLYKEMTRLYKEKLDSLPAQRRKIFHLSREKNMSYEEIAKELNLSVHTVRNQMSSSLQYLRKHLGKFEKALPFILVAFLISKP